MNSSTVTVNLPDNADVTRNIFLTLCDVLTTRFGEAMVKNHVTSIAIESNGLKIFLGVDDPQYAQLIAEHVTSHEHCVVTVSTRYS